MGDDGERRPESQLRGGGGEGPPGMAARSDASRPARAGAAAGASIAGAGAPSPSSSDTPLTAA